MHDITQLHRGKLFANGIGNIEGFILIKAARILQRLADTLKGNSLPNIVLVIDVGKVCAMFVFALNKVVSSI